MSNGDVRLFYLASNIIRFNYSRWKILKCLLLDSFSAPLGSLVVYVVIYLFGHKIDTFYWILGSLLGWSIIWVRDAIFIISAMKVIILSRKEDEDGSRGARDND